MRPSHRQLAALTLCACTALTGCMGAAGSAQYAQVRFVEASPDAPALDIHQNSSPVLYNLGFGSASSYIPITPGAYTYAVNTASLHQQLGSAAGTLAAGGQYTVLVGNTAAALQVGLLRDQSTAAPAGQCALRVLHQATRVGAVDLYLVPAGGGLAGVPPFATNISFGNAPAYINLPSGTYSIVALPSGSVRSAAAVTLHTGSQADYPAGSARTVVLIDQSVASTPGVQILSVDDFDSPNTP